MAGAAAGAAAAAAGVARAPAAALPSAPVAVSRERLPAGWEQQVAPGGQTYYVNHILQTTQWEPPPPAS